MDFNDRLRTREYAADSGIWSPTVDPYIAPENFGQKTNAICVNLSDETPVNIGIWQIGDSIYSLVVNDNKSPLAPSNLECEGQANPANVLDIKPEFTGIYNANGDTDEAIRCQIEVKDAGGTFVSAYTAVNLDAVAGISTAIASLQTGDITCYSLGGVSGGNPVDMLGSLVNNVYTGGDTLDAAKPLYLEINNGASCTAGDTLTITLGDASTLTVYLPEIAAGDWISLFITDDGSTWYCGNYCNLAQVNPTTPWLSGDTAFATAVPDANRCENVESTNNFVLDGSQYNWRMRMQDSCGSWGAWSDGTDHFTMAGP